MSKVKRGVRLYRPDLTDEERAAAHERRRLYEVEQAEVERWARDGFVVSDPPKSAEEDEELAKALEWAEETWEEEDQ